MTSILKPLALTSIFMLMTTAQAQQLFLFGHFEVQIDYDLSPANPDDGWNFSISYDDDNDFNDREGITRNDPDDLILFAAPNSQSAIPDFLPRFGTIGDPFWVLPHTNVPGTLYLGQRIITDQGLFQTVDDGAFRPSPLGSLMLDMTQVTGSGPDAGGFYAMWESRQFGSLEFHFDSSDGIDGNDHLEPIEIGGHTHYNWGMTQPGTYEVTFKVTGKLNPHLGDQITSAEKNYTFAVPFTNTVPSGAELRMGLTPNHTLAAVLNEDESVEYATGQVALLASPANQSAPSQSYTFLLNIATDKPAAANRMGIDIAETLTFSGGLTPASKPYELLEAIGPGELTVLDESNDSVLLSFSEVGIYRLRMRALGRRITDDAVVAGEPFTLTLLAGIKPDYDYSAWAESFEKTHGLDAGALDDVDADSDDDGLINRIEFLLFWHGFDPVIADSHLLPSSNGADTPASFLMDSYKDDFSSSVADSTPRYSNIWTTQNGKVGIFTLGQQPGNAYGRLLYVAHLRDDLLPLEAQKIAQAIEYFATEATSTETGWIELASSLGWTNVREFPWIYHQNFGWLLARGSGIDNAWLWDPQLNWLWTTGNIFPWVWIHEQQVWRYLYGESDKLKWLYDPSSQAWVNL